jgi:hypothetical protein
MNGVIFCCASNLYLGTLWIQLLARVTWPYSVLHVHSLVSTFPHIHLVIRSMFHILLSVHVHQSSTHLMCRWLYRRNIVVDGNFSLEHMKMKQPSQDVFLNDGCGYVVASAPYMQHLQNSTESIQVGFSYVARLHFPDCFSILSDLLVPITRL